MIATAYKMSEIRIYGSIQIKSKGKLIITAETPEYKMNDNIRKSPYFSHPSHS